MNLKIIIISLFSFFVKFSYAHANSEVPMLVWNIKGSGLNLQPVSAFKTNSESIFAKILKATSGDHSTSVVVFLVDKLSMEDFSVKISDDDTNNTVHNLEIFLDEKPHMFIPSVNNPLKHLYNTACKPVYIEAVTVERVKDAVSSALDQACMVIVSLPSTGIISSKSTMSKSGLTEIFAPTSKASKKNVIGIFTGEKSSWNSNESNRKARSLLSVDVSEDNMINITGCLLMYSENVTLEIGDNNNDTRLLPLPPTASGICANTSTLELKFGQAGDISEVVIRFTFDVKRAEWYLSDSTIAVTGGNVPNEELHMKSSSIFEAPLGFSYSCGNLVLKAINSTVPLTISISRFQIQPYEVNYMFSASFDCVPFFTLPIWMGIFVAILFIIIMNTGIYALFAIKTMDRFDDPKGKTISVPLSLE